MTTAKIEASATRTAAQAIAIASSLGGIKALQTVLGDLTVDFPGAIIVVQHLSSLVKSNLAKILSRHTALKVETAAEGSPLFPGVVYVAPPDDHIVVNQDCTLSLSHEPTEHFVRPSAEYTFKSLAQVYQDQAIAVVLTGYDGDGKEGVQVIKKKGGRVIAQDENTSEVFGMPKSAIETGCVDLVLPLEQIADAIINIVNT